MDKKAWAIWKSIRPHQWIKNVFIFAPLFFTPEAINLGNIIKVLIGFAVFSLIASTIYIFNDYQDRAADRLHPYKKNRPIAAELLSLRDITPVIILLLLIGILGAVALNFKFALICLVYIFVNTAYSLYLKSMAIIDISCISLGFILRVVAGAVLVNVKPSVWILVCSGLLAFFLAIAKRRDDLIHALDHEHRKSLSGYNLQFIDVSMTIVLSALLLSYTIYTTEPEVIARMHTSYLFLTVPFVFTGILRYLQLTIVHGKSESPTHIILFDRNLWCVIIGWVLTFAALMYF